MLDLGCAPGSWSRWVTEQLPRARVLGIDLKPVDGFPGTFIEGSVYDVPLDTIREALGGSPDLVLSDMAPSTTGHRLADHVAQLELAQRAAELATQLLVVGGAFVCKVFDGEDAPAFVASLRPSFTTVKRVKPEATRTVSREFFVVCLGRR